MSKIVEKQTIKEYDDNGNLVKETIVEKTKEEEKLEKKKIIKALAKIYFAYINADKDNPHKFELQAIDKALTIMQEYGGLEKLLKEE